MVTVCPQTSLRTIERPRAESSAEGGKRVARCSRHGHGEVGAATSAPPRRPITAPSLDDLIAQSDDTDDEVVSAWATMLAEPGNISLSTMLVEIDKLNSVRFVGIPAGVLSDVAPSVAERWRTRAAVESPSHLRTHPDELRWALLATTLVVRERELVDVLVDLLIKTVHRIGARAGRRVTKELTNAFKKVRGKENILFSIASAALDG